MDSCPKLEPPLFFFFVTLDTGPQKALEPQDECYKVYEPEERARLSLIGGGAKLAGPFFFFFVTIKPRVV